MSKIKFRLEVLESGYLLFQILEMDDLFNDHEYVYKAANGIKIRPYTTFRIEIDSYNDVVTLYMCDIRKDVDRCPVVKHFVDPLKQKNRILEALKEWIDSTKNDEDGKNNSNIYEY